MISPSQTHLPDDTQRSQEKDAHPVGGIRTRSLDKRGATDPRLRPRRQRDRLGGGKPVHKGKFSLFTSHVTADIPKLHQSWYWLYLK